MVVQLQYVPDDADLSRLPERFERKFYLAPREQVLAHGLLRATCLADSQYPSEQINSLYFDTSDLDQHQRSSSGDYQKDKVRLRWYGTDEGVNGTRTVFVELKSRRAFASTKQRLRVVVPAENIAQRNLGKGIVPASLLMDTLARFGHFPGVLLKPVIVISYWRYRFSEITTGQRVALDCRIRSTMVMPGCGNGERALELPGAVIEIKGRTMELPATLTRARMLDTDWTRFSKYSACIDSHDEAPGTVGRLSPSGRIVQA